MCRTLSRAGLVALFALSATLSSAHAESEPVSAEEVSPVLQMDTVDRTLPETAGAAAADTPAAPISQCALTVGWEEWRPYQFEDASGRVTGLDIELMRLIGEKAGCTLSFTEQPWKRLLASVEQGSVDVLPGASRTPERAEYAYFTDPYREEAMKVVLRRQDLEAVASLPIEALVKGDYGRIGLVREYHYGDTVKALENDPEWGRVFDWTASDETNLKKVAAGRLYAAVMDQAVAVEKPRDLGLDQRLAIHPIAVHSDDIYLMVSKASQDEETVARLNDAIALVKASPDYNRLIREYLGDWEGS